MWGIETHEIEAMARTRSNSTYLPGIDFPDGLEVTTDFQVALDGAEEVLLVVPSHAFRETLQRLDTIASDDADNALRLARSISTDNFRGYPSTDIVGVEVGGATKNVLAIGAGISDGLGFGANTRIALVTRGLMEMTRLGLALGAQKDTFMGLSGVGDLVLTCTDDQSRNRRFGLGLAKGADVDAAREAIGQTVEGFYAARAVRNVAAKLKVDMPIVAEIYKVVYEGKSPQDAVTTLMSRPISPE